MTFEQWWWEFILEHPEWQYADSDALRKAAFNAGAASRDAEIAELKAKLSLLDYCATEYDIKFDQLRKDVEMLREALEKCAMNIRARGDKK